jgi:hypothetical protein
MSFLTGAPKPPKPIPPPEPPPVPAPPPAAALPGGTPTAFSPGRSTANDPYATQAGLGATILTSPLGTRTRTTGGKNLIGQ